MNTKNRRFFIYGIVIALSFFLLPEQVYAKRIEGHIRESQTWNRFDGPYVISEQIQVFPEATLTILPGTEILFTDTGRLHVRGKIVANGTNERRIIVSSESFQNQNFAVQQSLEEGTENKDIVIETPEIIISEESVIDTSVESIVQEALDVVPTDIEVLGDVAQINVMEEVVATNQGDYVDTGIIVSALPYESTAYGEFSFIDFSYTDYGISYNMNAEIIVDNASFSDINYFPLYGTEGSAEVTRSTFSGSEYAGYVQYGTFLHHGNIFNTSVPGWMYSPDLTPGKSHSITNTDGVYYLSGGSLSRTATLTIGPGVSLYVPNIVNPYLNVEGNLIMKGTPEKPIVIYSDKACTTPDMMTFNVYRWWGYHNPVPPDPVVDLEHVHFKNLCNGIKITHGVIHMNSVSFSDIANEAFRAEGTAGVDIRNSEIKNSGIGISLFGVIDNAVIVNNKITGNDIGARAESIMSVDVRNNDWGSNTGPSLAHNPGGEGDAIVVVNVGEVLYCKWLQKPLEIPCPPGSDKSRFDNAQPEPVLKKDPLILIPGITGTDLSKRYDDYSKVWLNIPKTVANVADSHLDDLALLVEGVESPVRPMEVGAMITTAPGLDIFEGLITELKNAGYREGVDLFFFPYDWRMSISVTAETLNAKVAEVLALTKKTKVDMLGHSMGGLVAQKYIADFGKDSVDQLLFVGTPHTGAPKAFKTLLYGDTMGVGLDIGIDTIALLNAERIKTISQNMPSVYELLPSAKYIATNGPYVADLAEVYEPLENEEVLTFLNKDQTERFMIQEGGNARFFDAVDSVQEQVSGVDLTGIQTYNIAACGATKTIDKVLIKRKRPTKLFGMTFGKEYELSYAAGDATVPLASADAIQSNYRFYSKTASHAKLPSEEMVRRGIVSILKGGEMPVESDTFSQSKNICGVKGTVVAVHSPVSLSIQGGAGEYVGPVPGKSGQISRAIQEVSYDVIDDEKFAFIPGGASYTVAFTAEDIGVFDVSINDTNENDVITKRRFYYNVPIAGIQTKAYIQILGDGTSDYVLHIDQDGDDVYESVRYPVVINGPAVNDITPPTTFSSIEMDTLTLAAKDIESGLLQTLYSVDDQISWHHYSRPLSFTEDTTVEFFSVDNIGNTEQTKNIVVSVKNNSVPLDPEEQNQNTPPAPNPGTDTPPESEGPKTPEVPGGGQNPEEPDEELPGTQNPPDSYQPSNPGTTPGGSNQETPSNSDSVQRENSSVSIPAIQESVTNIVSEYEDNNPENTIAVIDDYESVRENNVSTNGAVDLYEEDTTGTVEDKSSHEQFIASTSSIGVNIVSIIGSVVLGILLFFIVRKSYKKVHYHHEK